MEDTEIFRRADDLLGELLELSVEEQKILLDQRCADDPALRSLVERLLSFAMRTDPGLDPGAGVPRTPVESIGDRIDRYRLVRVIGRGGMGVVYLAEDERLARRVAIKVLADVVDPASRERFLREARIAANLDHPNIVTVFDAGEIEAHPYLVMELVNGHSLQDRPPEGDDEILTVAGQVCSALSHAHGKGLVHRDVKPANLLATRTGPVLTTKLADFGITLVGDATRLTRGGRISGTPAYMAPEQALGREVDPRTDLYALGVMLYRWTTGRFPFEADSGLAMISQHLHAVVTPPERFRPDVPPTFRTVILRLLEKDPADRFESAVSVRDALVGNAPVPVVRTSRSPGPDTPPEVVFCRTSDGLNVACASHGEGPTLVRVLGWFTHLEREWEWPELRFLWEELGKHFRVVRYDGRGMGLSDPVRSGFTEESRQADLDAVLDRLGVERCALLGISEGGWTAAEYARRHPERVSHLVIYGAYARGKAARPGFDPEEEQALLTLVRKAWGRDTPTFRSLFTNDMFPSDTDPALLDHFYALQRETTDPENAAAYMAACHARGDGRPMLACVQVPTLVLHRPDDAATPFAEGRMFAASVPGARLISLPGDAHKLLGGQPGTNDAIRAIVDFVHAPRTNGATA